MEKDISELLRILDEAEEDISVGRVAPIEETFQGIREKLCSKLS